MLTRRDTARLTLSLGATALAGSKLRAADQLVKVGIDLSLTGADAESALRIKYGALLAFDAANAAGAVPGVRIEVVTFDDGTPTAGQYDPAQAATNARRMVGDRAMMAAIGPQMSGAAKAMVPVLAEGELAIITPAATSPDLTDPRFATQYRPDGKPVFFRTVTTDQYQGPGLANYFAETLGVRAIYVLDDSGAFGVGLADAFQKQAAAKGIKVLGRDRLDPKAADYSAVLTKIRALAPDSLYYGGVLLAGVKLVKQSYDILPDVKKGGGDGLVGPEMLTAAGFPAAEGWYATVASPHLAGDTGAAEFVEKFRARYGVVPDDYAITAYDGALVIVDALRRVQARDGKISRAAVREAIASASVPTLQGTVAFDANGDLKDRTVSIFQVRHDASRPLEALFDQYRYVGVAPQA
jgi:branched-chain amino acid transport system substrate-binding protein